MAQKRTRSGAVYDPEERRVAPANRATAMEVGEGSQVGKFKFKWK